MSFLSSALGYSVTMAVSIVGVSLFLFGLMRLMNAKIINDVAADLGWWALMFAGVVRIALVSA